MRRSIAIAITVALALALSGVSGCSDFSRHRDRYERVVRQARELATTSERTFRFRGSWVFDPVAAATDTNVCAARAGRGGLFVRIVAYDRHHGGRRGYVYADPAMTAVQVREALDAHGCGEWEDLKQIGGAWWSIASRLD